MSIIRNGDLMHKVYVPKLVIVNAIKVTKEFITGNILCEIKIEKYSAVLT